MTNEPGATMTDNERILFSAAISGRMKKLYRYVSEALNSVYTGESDKVTIELDKDSAMVVDVIFVEMYSHPQHELVMNMFEHRRPAPEDLKLRLDYLDERVDNRDEQLDAFFGARTMLFENQEMADALKSVGCRFATAEFEKEPLEELLPGEIAAASLAISYVTEIETLLNSSGEEK